MENFPNAVQTQVHISQIKSGDTILHEGKVTTVCQKNIKHDSFIGKTLFGDSYRSGRILVTKIDFIVPK